MTTALEIVNVAYRDHNMQELSSFSTTLEFPYNLGKDLINEVIRDLNRLGNYWFTETRTALSYTPASSTYSFRTLGIDPKKVIRIRREATNTWGELVQVNWRQFQQRFRTGSVQTGQPGSWSKFGDTMELDVIPSQDYSLAMYHFSDMPLVSATTDSQTTGGILVPENDEDLLQRGCYFYLGYKIGKWDYATALQLLRAKAVPFLVNVSADSGLPSQLPSNF